MKRAVLASLLIILVFASSIGAAPETHQSTKPAPPSRPDKKTLLAKAQHEDVSAQFWLGTGYEQGWFGKPDFQEALKWLRRAAKHGNPDAQNCLGQMYEDGEGVPQNYVLAAQWYRSAAEHVPDFGGAGQGRNNLGMLYLQGLGVPKDYVKAYMWFSVAGANSNLAAAQEKMNPEQIREAQQQAKKWKKQHPDPTI
jgi:TPR repeat protein